MLLLNGVVAGFPVVTVTREYENSSVSLSQVTLMAHKIWTGNKMFIKWKSGTLLDATIQRQQPGQNGLPLVGTTDLHDRLPDGRIHLDG
jgi:hypothetical protein